MTTPLQQLIIEHIQKEGPISFAVYMRMALYHPGYGYYVAGPARMGWDGDYYTSSDVSTLFAHCMGRQLQQMWQKMGCPARFLVLEQGAGRGDLAQEIRAWAAQAAPAFGAALDYRTEDIRWGQDESAIQEEVSVGGIIPSGRTAHPWRIRAATNVPSVILSNELIDAFPVHLVEVRDSRLYEVYVAVHEGRLCEVLGEPSSPELADYLDTYKIPWRTFGDDWRGEVCLDALRWVRRTARLLHKGYILTIDYGDKARDLYTLEQPRGTLVCYYRHHLNDHPLARPGEQDITAHVNFSALIDEARRQGLHVNAFTTQQRWLQSMGIDEELERLRATEFAPADSARATDQGQVALLQWYNVRQRVATLLDPKGLGNFKVLILRRS